MKNEQNWKSFIVGILVRLICLVLMSLLLLVVQTYIVQRGKISIDYSLNWAIHFILVAGVGLGSVMLSRKHNTGTFMTTTVLFYVLLLFVSVVVFDGIRRDYVYSLVGGFSGSIVSILVSIAHIKKRGQWHRKKYSC